MASTSGSFIYEVAKALRFKTPHSLLNPPTFGSSEEFLEDSHNMDLQGVIFGSFKSLTPWTIDVGVGQDVMSKIMEFCERMLDQVVCVISATGSLSEITFTLPFVDKITYKGQFKIINLSGSFDPINRGGRERKGAVSITFARRDGCYEGGSVVGQLIVVNFVKVIVGTFKTGFKKVTSEEPRWKKEPTFVVENKKDEKEGNDVGPSGVHEHELENDANPASI